MGDQIGPHDLDVAKTLGEHGARLDSVEAWQNNFGNKIERLIASNTDLAAQVKTINDRRFNPVRIIQAVTTVKGLISWFLALGTAGLAAFSYWLSVISEISGG